MNVNQMKRIYIAKTGLSSQRETIMWLTVEWEFKCSTVDTEDFDTEIR